MSGRSIRRLGFLIVFAGLLVLVGRLFYPFLTVIVWSSIFYAFLFPVYERLIARKDGTIRGGAARSAWASLLALGGVLLFAVPAALVGIAVVRQFGYMARETLLSIERNPAIVGLGPDGPLSALLSSLSGGAIDPGAPALGIRGLLSLQAERILGFSGKLLRDLLSIVLNLVFMVFTIYFLLVDGRHLAGLLADSIPIERGYTNVFLQRFKEAGRSLVTGYFLVGILQAIVMLGLCLAFSVKGALAIAAITAVASFIPKVGTAMIWIPVAAMKFADGDTRGAILFLVCSATLIWTIDIFLRPLFLRGRLKIHPLLIFFSILGGLGVFKFNGLVLGPLILIIFFTALEFFRRAYDAPPGSTRRRIGDPPEA